MASKAINPVWISPLSKLSDIIFVMSNNSQGYKLQRGIDVFCTVSFKEQVVQEYNSRHGFFCMQWTHMRHNMERNVYTHGEAGGDVVD